jgi:polyisoprenoid-binding protein YceI
MTGLLMVLALSASDPVTLQLDTAKSTVSYTGVHKFHTFVGVTHSLQGAARILPDGTAQIQVRAPATSFDSGNGNRDAHMKETVEADKYPDIKVKCLAKLTGPTSQKATADCEITMHGASEKVSVPVDLTFDSPSSVHAVGTFAVSWDGFHIERPKLLFVPIDDKGDIKVDLRFGAAQ